MLRRARTVPPIGGFVASGFEPVREAFFDNFRHRKELGAAFCVHHKGEVVVDLWGGTADPRSGRSWTRDTPMVVFSATKGLAALRMLQLTEAGDFDPDAPVREVWPSFDSAGKHDITGRMILNHRSGLSAVDGHLTLDDFAGDQPSVRAAMEAQEPLWAPDTEQGYAACSYGMYIGELHRRVASESIGTAFAREVVEPLGLDMAIGADDDLIERAARLVPMGPRELATRHLPTALLRRTPEGALFRRLARKGTDVRRAFTNPHMGGLGALNNPAYLRLELPWVGALTTAHSLSRVYAAMVGEVDGVRLVRPQSIDALRPRQSWSAKDRVIRKPLGWSQGFLKEESTIFSPNPSSFGHAGAGGSVGWADPDAELSMGYVMNRMDWRIRSPRALALCRATYDCL